MVSEKRRIIRDPCSGTSRKHSGAVLALILSLNSMLPIQGRSTVPVPRVGPGDGYDDGRRGLVIPGEGWLTVVHFLKRYTVILSCNEYNCR